MVRWCFRGKEFACQYRRPGFDPWVGKIPWTDPVKSRARQRILLEGDIPSPVDPPSGCRFHTRCPYATERCRNEQPELNEYGPGHFAACHLLENG